MRSPTHSRTGSVAVGNSGAYLQVEMGQHGLLRPLLASELSDGRYGI
jgi:hypothetical protein